MIKTEIGMPVLYQPKWDEEFRSGGQLSAQIAHVWSDSSVNLVVFDMHGNPHQRESVLLWQPGDTDMRSTLGRWCQFPEWFVRVMNPAPPPMFVQYGGIAHDQLARHWPPLIPYIAPPALVPAGSPDNIQGTL